MEGLDVWVHEGGWTLFPTFANYLLTGKAGVVTNSEGRVLDKYLARAVNGVLASGLPAELVPEQRRREVEALRWLPTAAEAIERLGGREARCEPGGPVNLESQSADLCHSGGALEHYRPDELQAFLKECFRVLRRGGVASHILDHRDHLHHTDDKLPFLSHLAWPDLAYRVFLGHELGYHNRLLPGEVEAMFEEAGFERVALRRMILPSREYVEGARVLEGEAGVSRRWLRGRYRQASEEDLRTAAGHYLYRKP